MSCWAAQCRAVGLPPAVGSVGRRRAPGVLLLAGREGVQEGACCPCRTRPGPAGVNAHPVGPMLQVSGRQTRATRPAPDRDYLPE
jgi:hypothetical protein